MPSIEQNTMGHRSIDSLMMSFVLFTASTGCPRDRSTIPQPVASEIDAASSSPVASTSGAPSAFGAMLGASPKVVPASSGAYAGSSLITRSQLPTMETTIDDYATGRATLTLDASGRATGCFVSRASHSWAKSHFATKSGKNEGETRKTRTFAGARGIWARGKGPYVDIHFEDVVRDDCTVPVALTPGASYGSFDLHCLGIEANATLPAPVLLCAPGQSSWPIDDSMVALATGAPEKWLVLGEATTGIAMTSEFGRRDKEPTITFEKKLLPLVPSQWTKDP